MEQGGTRLTGSQAEQLILGNTLLTHGTDPRGRAFNADLYVDPNGKTHAIANSGGREVENRGQYTFNKDGLCFEWTLQPRWGKGCATVYKKPDGEYAVYQTDNGREISSFKILKGNPKGL